MMERVLRRWRLRRERQRRSTIHAAADRAAQLDRLREVASEMDRTGDPGAENAWASWRKLSGYDERQFAGFDDGQRGHDRRRQ